MNRACFPKEKHQNSQKWAKFMNFSFWPCLWFGLPGRLLNFKTLRLKRKVSKFDTKNTTKPGKTPKGQMGPFSRIYKRGGGAARHLAMPENIGAIGIAIPCRSIGGSSGWATKCSADSQLGTQQTSAMCKLGAL